MQTRHKVSLLFVLCTGIILALSFATIYSLASANRQNIFYERLREKAEQLITNFDANKLKEEAPLLKYFGPFETPLYNEEIRIFDLRLKTIDQKGFNTIIPLEKIKSLLASKDSSVLSHYKGYEFCIWPFSFEGKNYYLLVSAYNTLGYKNLNQLTQSMLIIYLFALIFSAAVAWFYSGRILAPLSALGKQMSEIEANNLNQSLAEPKLQDELGVLIVTFNQMLERLRNSFESQKIFVANASHELRTPITALQSHIEIALMRERTPAFYQDKLRNMLNEIKSLSKLLDSLILLAQPNLKDQYDFKHIRIDELLHTIREELLEFDPRFNIQINYTNDAPDEQQLTFYGNEGMIKSAFRNLVHNACKFSPDHTAKINLRCEASATYVEIIDQGPGIPTESQKFIFQPFYRAPASLAIPGNGLGLALVERVCRVHKIPIHLQSEPEKGCCFTLSFNRENTIN